MYVCVYVCVYVCMYVCELYLTPWICSVETPRNRHAWTAHLKTHDVSSSLHLGGPGGEIDRSNCGISWSLEATGRLNTDTQLLTQYLRCGRPGASQIVRSSNWVHKWSTVCVCTYKGVQLKSTLQHTGTWSAAAWQPRSLCYRLAVFFLNLRLLPFSFPQGKLSARFKIVTLCFFLFFKKKKCINLKLRSLNCASQGVTT